jgi:hypothetical protein
MLFRITMHTGTPHQPQGESVKKPLYQTNMTNWHCLRHSFGTTYTNNDVHCKDLSPNIEKAYQELWLPAPGYELVQTLETCHLLLAMSWSPKQTHNSCEQSTKIKYKQQGKDKGTFMGCYRLKP